MRTMESFCSRISAKRLPRWTAVWILTGTAELPRATIAYGTQPSALGTGAPG